MTCICSIALRSYPWKLVYQSIAVANVFSTAIVLAWHLQRSPTVYTATMLIEPQLNFLGERGLSDVINSLNNVSTLTTQVMMTFDFFLVQTSTGPKQFPLYNFIQKAWLHSWYGFKHFPSTFQRCCTSPDRYHQFSNRPW